MGLSIGNACALPIPQSCARSLGGAPQPAARADVIIAAATAPGTTLLAPHDAMFLRTNPRPFVVSGLLFFGAPTDPTKPMNAATLRTLIDNKLRHVDRFTSCLERDTRGRDMWRTDPAFDARHHVSEISCAGPLDGPEMTALVEALHNRPLHSPPSGPLKGAGVNRPPWDMTLIACADQRTAVLVRVHHAMADGMRLMQAMLECNDDPEALASVRAQAQQLAAARQAHRAAVSPPTGVIGSLLGTIAHTLGFVRDSARLIGRGLDPQTCIKPRQAAERVLAGAMHKPWQLDDMKALAKKLGGGTLNDLLLAVVTGAVRRVMLQRGEVSQGMKLHCFMPINTIPIGDGKGMGNALAIGMPALPVGEPDTQARYDQARAANQAVKTSGEPYVAQALSCLVARLPESAQRTLLTRTTQQTSVLLTNVRGPATLVSLQQHPVTDVRFFMPPWDHMGIMVPVITYCGRVNMSLNLDPRLNIGMAELQRAVEQEYQALQACARQA